MKLVGRERADGLRGSALNASRVTQVLVRQASGIHYLAALDKELDVEGVGH